MLASEDTAPAVAKRLAAMLALGVLAAVIFAKYTVLRAYGFNHKVAATVHAIARAQDDYFAREHLYTTDLDALGDIALDGVSISIASGNSGDLESSFRIAGSHPQAHDSYSWISDPPADAPHLTTP